MSGMSLDEFLGHKSSERGAGGKILNWRKRKPAAITTWLHTKANLVALWRHGWPRLVDFERDGAKSVEVWGGTFNCHEQEDVLKRQYKRTNDGDRIAPPQVCPICLLAEYLRQQVQAGKMAWTDPVFRFEGDNPDQTNVLTAAGIYNGYSGDLSRDEVADLRRAGIRRDEAWKQNAMAKCSYVFSIADNDAPAEGVQVCVETTALGDAVKRVIRDQMDALGETEGHPLKTPYAIRWEYHPEETEFNRKYRALAMPRAVLTPEIQALIMETDAPDIQPMIAKGNVGSLRMAMETHALVDLPFDKLFAAADGSAEQVAPKQESRTEVGRVVQRPPATGRRGTPEPEPAPEPVVTQRRRAAPPKPAEPTMPEYPKGTVIIPCDSCGAKMADTDDTCWKCGAKYEMDEPAPTVAKAKPAPRGGPVKAGGLGALPASQHVPDPDPTNGADDDMPW